MIAARLARDTEFGLQALLAHSQDLASTLLRFCTPRHEESLLSCRLLLSRAAEAAGFCNA
jgi:hypothetical protein